MSPINKTSNEVIYSISDLLLWHWFCLVCKVTFIACLFIPTSWASLSVMYRKWKCFIPRGFRDAKIVNEHVAYVTKPNSHCQSLNRYRSRFPFALMLGPSWCPWGKYLQNVEPKSIFHSTKISHRTGEGRLLDPRRPKSPRGIWFAFQLFWHGFGVMHCVPLKVNRCRLNHVANLQQRATRCCSLPPFDSCCGARAACAKKARLREKKPPTFSPLCSNITLQCPTLIILYGVNFTLLSPRLWLCVCVRICFA